MITSQQVHLAADAFRRTMAQGDIELASSELEKKILQAIAAQGAADLADFLITRVSNGKALAKPLEDLAPALEKRNTIGTSLRAIEQQAITQAKAIASAILFGGTWPLWLSSLVAVIVGIFGFAYDAGTSVGTVLLPLLLGGGSTLALIVRGVQQSQPAIRAVGGAVGDAFGSVHESITTMGRRAERIYKTNTDAVFATLYASYGGRPTAVPVVGKLRAGGSAALYFTYAICAICAIFFALGLWHALETYLACPTKYGGRCYSGSGIGGL